MISGDPDAPKSFNHKESSESQYSVKAEMGIALSNEDKHDIHEMWRKWTKSDTYAPIENRVCFVARSQTEEAGRHPVIGIMTLSGNRGATTTGFLADLVVDEKYRGRGVARKIFEKAIAYCEDAGLTTLIAQRNDELTSSSAVNIHDELGFRITGQVKRADGTIERETIQLDLPKKM